MTEATPEAVLELPAPAPAAKPAKIGIVPFVGGLALLTVISAAGGGAVGYQVFSTIERVVESRPEPQAAPLDSQYAGSTSLRRLTPILTNLAVPEDAWIRLESSIVFDAETISDPDLLASQIGQDLLSYLRTVSLAQIQGASGLQHLREDLSERAAIRSGRAVREVIIETLVVQ